MEGANNCLSSIRVMFFLTSWNQELENAAHVPIQGGRGSNCPKGSNMKSMPRSNQIVMPRKRVGDMNGITGLIHKHGEARHLTVPSMRNTSQERARAIVHKQMAFFQAQHLGCNGLRCVLQVLATSPAKRDKDTVPWPVYYGIPACHESMEHEVSR